MSMDEVLVRMTAGLDRDEAAASLRVSYERPATLRRTVTLPDGQIVLVNEDGKYAATAVADMAKFMERHDPAHVLRMVEAIRKVLAIKDNREFGYNGLDELAAVDDALGSVLEALAGIYTEPTEES